MQNKNTMLKDRGVCEFDVQMKSDAETKAYYNELKEAYLSLASWQKDSIVCDLILLEMKKIGVDYKNELHEDFIKIK